jgi:hypothetical protein
MNWTKANYLKKFYAVGIITAGLLFGACSTDDEGLTPDKEKEDDPIVQIDPPIVLDCQHFNKNPNTVLKDNPNAPIDYIVKCHLTIDDDVIIEPGVTIAFETDTGFWVHKGSLNAVGTAEKPITFTGINKERGSWGGVFFASNNPKNEMNHTIYEYAGGKAVSWATNEVGGVVIGSGASLKFNNNLVQHCKNWGLSLYYSANDATTTIENNTFKANEKPLQVSLNFVGLVKGDNKFIDNTSNKAEISCQYAIAKTQTLHKLSVPYLVRGLFNFEIGKEGNLTIEPGTVIEMATDKNIVVKGSLKAVGTPSKKIIIRGETEAQGSWGNIVFNSGSPNNQINYVEIKHAGAKPTSYHLNKGAIAVNSSSRLDLNNTHFSNIFNCPIYKTDNNTSIITGMENITTHNINGAGLPDCQ